MKKMVPVLVALSLILLILLGVLGFKLIQKYTPSKELSDLSQLYQVQGNEIALLYNYELQSAKGLYENGQCYLPLSWVNERLNKRFYWDQTEELLVYALPDQIVYADPGTKGASGAPLLLMKGDEVYLTLGLIANYTNVQASAFDAEEVKRVYITDWGLRKTAQLKKDGKVREKGGIKSPIITEAHQAFGVTILEEMDKWSKVLTADGHIGYIQNKIIGEAGEELTHGTTAEPVYGWTGRDQKLVLAWHQVTSQSANGALESVLEGTKGINVISPTWFSLTDNEGNYTSLASREYVEKAHSLGIEVWALLDNFSKDVQTETLLASTTTRRRLINSLIAEAEEYGLDGLNMDFESIKPEAGVHYVQFLRELSIPCREKGIVLSVDNTVPALYNEFYDRAEQAVVADYVIIMGYDEHYAGGEPGSVASLPYVQDGIEQTLRSVPADRLINGVPFYTRLWTEGTEGIKSKALGIAEAKRWVEENETPLYWQEELGQYYGECETEEGLAYLWLEEEESLRLKMDLVKEHDLAGVACWKLGLEDKAAWSAVSWD